MLLTAGVLLLGGFIYLFYFGSFLIYRPDLNQKNAFFRLVQPLQSAVNETPTSDKATGFFTVGRRVNRLLLGAIKHGLGLIHYPLACVEVEYRIQQANSRHLLFLTHCGSLRRQPPVLGRPEQSHHEQQHLWVSGCGAQFLGL